MSDPADTIRVAEGVLAGEPGARYMGVDRDLAERALALVAEIQRLRDALDSVDAPYPIDVFPDLQERDAVFAAMRAVNRYATEQFAAEIARQRGKAARALMAGTPSEDTE